jgi:putative ABC transport system permease protein
MTLFHDLRLALRSAVRSLGFSAATIAVMALGVGATTFAFVAINAVLLQPLPFPDADELVHIELVSAEQPNSFEIGMHDVRDLEARQSSFKSLFAAYSGTVNISGDDLPVRYDGTFVTANALDQLGVPPVLGRTFAAGDDVPGAPLAVIIGWNIWQQRYGADPEVIGRSLRVNGTPATIVGVMPNGFQWPIRNDLWVPMQLDVEALPRGEGPTVEAFGRLRAGAALEQAQAEFATLYAGILAANPGWNIGVKTVLKPYREEFVGQQTMAIFTAMQLATAFVLLIACANVANLILARAVSRSKEMSVRAALGASRWRLISGMLTESVLLSLVGGLLGILLAHAGGRGVERFLIESGDGFPYWVNFEADWRVAVFAIAVAVSAGIVAGLIPALRAAQRDVTEGLKSSGGGTSIAVGKVTRTLIGVEIALSCALLVGGALTVRSVINLQHAPIGAEVAGVMSGRIGLFDAQYPDASSRRQFWDSLEAGLATLPGVTGATVTTSLPAYGSGRMRYLPEGREAPPDGLYPATRTVVVTPGFFQLFQVPVMAGRVFTDADREDTLPVVVVNQAFAEQAWPGEEPVGKRLVLGGAESTQPPVTVIGVAGNVYHHGLQEGPVQPAIYQPLAQADARFASIAVRANGDSQLLANPIRDVLRMLDADVPVYWLQPAQVWVDQSKAGPKLLGVIFSVFGIAALLLAAVGVYGVLAFTVAQRTREFGIRRALGAEQGRLLGLVLRQGVWQLVIALPIGLVLAFGLGRILQGVLANVSSVDPVSFIGVPVLLVFIVIAASMVPARRAANVDPMAALRHE